MPRFENAVWKLLQNLGSLKIRTPHLAWYPLCQEILHGHKAGLGRLSSNFWSLGHDFFSSTFCLCLKPHQTSTRIGLLATTFLKIRVKLPTLPASTKFLFAKGSADVAHQILPRSPFKAKLCERTEVQSNNARLTVVSGMACFPVLLEFQDGTNIHRCQTRSNAS